MTEPKIVDHWVHNGSTYNNLGCRCAECRADHAERIKLRRAERRAALAEDPTLATHGLSSTYTNWGCRCTPCRLAHNKQHADFSRARRAKEKAAND